MAEDTREPDLRPAGIRTPPGEAGEFYAHGQRCFEDGLFEEATEALRRASELAPDHARIRSLFGLSVAYHEGDFGRARTLCESAVKQEFFNPELYLNLARVYLVFDRRAEALRYLRRGGMIDPGHDMIQQAMSGLGQRQAAILPFLPRKHPINRALGGARNLIVRSLERGPAASFRPRGRSGPGGSSPSQRVDTSGSSF